MNRSKRKTKKKRLTPSSIIGISIGFGLMAAGSYHALILGKPGAYFVVFLGVAFCGVIFWSYRG
jgi:hypothetical protein